MWQKCRIFVAGLSAALTRANRSVCVAGTGKEIRVSFTPSRLTRWAQVFTMRG